LVLDKLTLTNDNAGHLAVTFCSISAQQLTIKDFFLEVLNKAKNMKFKYFFESGLLYDPDTGLLVLYNTGRILVPLYNTSFLEF